MKIVRKSKPNQPLKPAGNSVAADEELLNRWYDKLSYRDRSQPHLLARQPIPSDHATSLDSQVAG
ncbi:MAG: hypothetical protein AAGJ55_01375, partial [Cyanobacteria bacterium J06555_12]